MAPYFLPSLTIFCVEKSVPLLHFNLQLRYSRVALHIPLHRNNLSLLKDAIRLQISTVIYFLSHAGDLLQLVFVLRRASCVTFLCIRCRQNKTKDKGQCSFHLNDLHENPEYFIIVVAFHIYIQTSNYFTLSNFTITFIIMSYRDSLTKDRQ